VVARIGAEDLNFTDRTTAAIVAGRTGQVELDAAGMRGLCRQIDALAARAGLPIGIVVASDLAASLVGVAADEPAATTVAVGLLIAWTDRPDPEPVAWDELKTALERARALPWAELAALIDLADDLAIWGCATGPLAGFHVAYGVPCRDQAQEPSYRPGTPQAVDPALEMVAGKDMRQRWIDDGVWGVALAYNGDWCMTELPFDARSHAERVALLGNLAPRAGYYLMSCYD
jgi:hypothetical protein